MNSDHFSKLIADRVHSWLIHRCATAHDRSCLFAAWNLIVNWRGYFGELAAKQKLDDAALLDRVDRWIEDLLAFVSYQSPHVLGVKLRTMLMKGAA